MKTIPTLPTLPSRPRPSTGVGNFSNKPHGITSIARQTGKTSAFRQFGDSISRTEGNDRSGKIFGSISRAIKNKTTSDPTLPTNKNNPLNQNYKPLIK